MEDYYLKIKEAKGLLNLNPHTKISDYRLSDSRQKNLEKK